MSEDKDKTPGAYTFLHISSASFIPPVIKLILTNTITESHLHEQECYIY